MDHKFRSNIIVLIVNKQQLLKSSWSTVIWHSNRLVRHKWNPGCQLKTWVSNGHMLYQTRTLNSMIHFWSNGTVHLCNQVIATCHLPNDCRTWKGKVFPIFRHHNDPTVHYSDICTTEQCSDSPVIRQATNFLHKCKQVIIDRHLNQNWLLSPELQYCGVTMI